MKELLLFVCAVISHVEVNSQQCGCGCTLPPLSCRPNPPLARPLPPCSNPLPTCPPSLPVCPTPPPVCPPPLSFYSRPLSAPAPVCPRPLPCPRLYECSPIVEYIDVPVSPKIQSPFVTYDVVAPCATALPTCNCPSPPTLPVSAQILPNIASPVIPFLNAGLNMPPCLGGIAEIGALSPLGLINPFLPAASPISALAPTVSSLYPPIDPCNCGCKYLRQIPMPPPCI